LIIFFGPSLKINIDNYPAIRDYLKTFGKRLEQTGEKGCRKKTFNKWFEHQDTIAYYEEFEKEKVVWGGVVTTKEFFKLRLCFVEKGIFLNAPANFMVVNKTNYFLGYLNSYLNNWFYNNFIGTVLHKDGVRFYVDDMFKIPIPPITPSNEPIVNQIEALVDKILAAKHQNPQAVTAAEEQEIDNLVYKLYELTEEEIKIMEGGK